MNIELIKFGDKIKRVITIINVVITFLTASRIGLITLLAMRGISAVESLSNCDALMPFPPRTVE